MIRTLLFPCVLVGITIIAAQSSHAQFTTVINVPPDSAPTLLSSDSQLNLFDGGELTTVQAGFNDDSSNNIEVNVFGGMAGGFSVLNGAVLNFHAGMLDGAVLVRGSGIANLWGGEGNSFAFPQAGGTLNISGGSAIGIIAASSGSSINLIGTEFILDGVDITATLSPQTPFVIGQREVPLTGRFADGTPFAYTLNLPEAGGRGDGGFPEDAILSVILVPEPTTALLMMASLGFVGVAGRRATR